MSNKEKQWSIPAVNCPACGRPIMYSSIPHKKGDYVAMLVESSFEDLFLICGKCKSKVRVINISGSVPERVVS